MLSGTVTAAASVGTRRRMNTATTISTNAMLASSVHSTSSTLARMVVVRSEMVVTRMSGGIHASSCGSAARTRSTVSITLAPAVLVSVSRMARFVPCQAASLVLATLSSTSATSPSRTVAPSADFSTSRAYSDACVIWPFSSMVSARCGPWKPPAGPVTLALRMAV